MNGFLLGSLVLWAINAQCLSNDDCFSTEFCEFGDTTECVSCPSGPCNLEDMSAESKDACIDSCDKSICADENDCEDNEFCNYNDQGDQSGECVACSLIDTNDANELQCLEDTRLKTWRSSRSCNAVCELAEMNAEPRTSVADPAFLPQLVKELEGVVCDDCCAPGSEFINVCPTMHDRDAYQCTFSYCDNQSKKCMYDNLPDGTACTNGLISAGDSDFELLGFCKRGLCLYYPQGLDSRTPESCANGYEFETRTFASCGVRGISQVFSFEGYACPSGADGVTCDFFGHQWSDVECWASSFKDENGQFDAHFHDPNELMFEGDEEGRCIIGEQDDCVINTPGYYNFREQDIIFQIGETDLEHTTMVYIDQQTHSLSPFLKCEDGAFCRGVLVCTYVGVPPCGTQAYATCRDVTNSPTVDPTLGADENKEITLSPTAEPTPSAHGDPIIWTFNDECYDLNKDGLYVSSSHPGFDHEIKIAVYNDFMREIQVVHASGEILLAINNLGDVLNNNYPYFFVHERRQCPEHTTECHFSFEEFRFDAQHFEYTLQIKYHDYLDQGLTEGESGIHLDIFPKPYGSFSENKALYTGIYFENPFPDELQYCPGGSRQYRTQ